MVIFVVSRTWHPPTSTLLKMKSYKFQIDFRGFENVIKYPYCISEHFDYQPPANIPEQQILKYRDRSQSSRRLPTVDPDNYIRRRSGNCRRDGPLQHQGTKQHYRNSTNGPEIERDIWTRHRGRRWRRLWRITGRSSPRTATIMAGQVWYNIRLIPGTVHRSSNALGEFR